MIATVLKRDLSAERTNAEKRQQRTNVSRREEKASEKGCAPLLKIVVSRRDRGCFSQSIEGPNKSPEREAKQGDERELPGIDAKTAVKQNNKTTKHLQTRRSETGKRRLIVFGRGRVVKEPASNQRDKEGKGKPNRDRSSAKYLRNYVPTRPSSQPVEPKTRRAIAN